MNRKAVKSFLICALAAVLLFSSGCGLISQVIASVFDGAPRDTKVTAPVLEKTDRDTSKNYYKEIEHETIPLSERPRNAFDQSAFDDCIGDFTALLKKTGNEKKLIDLYEEILDWIDVLETDYTLSDRDFYMDVSDEVLGDHLTELELQYMDNADAALRLFRDALKTDYADALRAYMGDELADSLAGYEDLTEEELELTRRQTELTQKYDALSIETPEDEEAWMRELKELYLELVDLNNEIARLHGYDNYAEYAYAEICMRDYTDADVEGIEDTVLSELLPLYLGYVDAIIDDGAIYSIYRTNRDKPEAIFSKMSEVIDAVFPELSESMTHLLENELYDMDYSDTKMEVGFTAALPAYHDALILYQPYQQGIDCHTYVHEFGHYNHYYHNDEHSLYKESTLDVDEIHSQGLELLFYDYYSYLDSTLGEGLKQNAVYTLLANILTGFAVNEAECRIYAAKNLTVEKLDAIWNDVDEKYMLDGFVREDSWFYISHVYESPLYYISYATSALAALELFSLSRADWDAGVECYLTISAVPTTDTYCQVLEDAGLSDVFEPKNIRKLSDSLTEILDVESYVAPYRGSSGYAGNNAA